MKTAYQVCQEMVECLDAEITAMKAEQRKTVDTADKAISMLPPERRVQLIMAELREMSPEYRSVVRAYLDELGEALL
jgi:DNA-directed RNA polymerase specialized sigma24 family protein